MFPLAWSSSKQSQVSHSTPESEVVAADTALTKTMVPVIALLHDQMNVPFSERVLYEDNEVAENCLRTGVTRSMQHLLSRTHGIAIQATAECIARERITVRRVSSDRMKADVFTKPFVSAPGWISSSRRVLIGSFAEDVLNSENLQVPTK